MRRALLIALGAVALLALFAGGWWLGWRGVEPPWLPGGGQAGPQETEAPDAAVPPEASAETTVAGTTVSGAAVAGAERAGAALPGSPIDLGITVGSGAYTTRLDAGDAARAAQALAALAAQEGVQFEPTYSVQVGAFVDEEEAQLLLDRLTQRGYEPEALVETTGAGVPLHLVRLGRFTSHRRARLAADLFAQREGLRAVPVQDHLNEVHGMLDAAENGAASETADGSGGEQPPVDFEAVEAGAGG